MSAPHSHRNATVEELELAVARDLGFSTVEEMKAAPGKEWSGSLKWRAAKIIEKLEQPHGPAGSYDIAAHGGTRNDALDEALNCYSPDDSATDWADKIRALKNAAPGNGDQGPPTSASQEAPAGGRCPDAAPQPEAGAGVAKDAARYRWLRSVDVFKGHPLPDRFWEVLGDSLDEEFDARIDEAMPSATSEPGDTNGR